MNALELVEAMTTLEALQEALDPDVMWYSADIDSNVTCNDREDAAACIERNAGAGLTGRFEVVGATDDIVVVSPVFEPPRRHDSCLLLRVRDDLIVEMRDFRSADEALRYAGLAATVGGGT